MAGTASSMLKSKSSINKHPRPKHRKKETIAITGEDVISNLPDAVLCHILSFIPTENAVATSVLSKRWKLLWTSVPNLDFSSESHSVNHTNFMNFVDRVLHENNVPRVRKVHLRCNWNCDPLRVKSWTNAIAWRDTEYFDLRLPFRCCIDNLDQISSVISLPDTFFSNQNLVELQLEGIGLKVPTSVNFPSLETIRFDRIQLLDDDSMKNLLSGCPILKSLDIHRSEWDNAQTLYICSASLGFLLLHTMACRKKDFGYKVVIDAPNLSKLILTDRADVDYDINDLSSLKKVYVSVQPDCIIVRDEESYAERLGNFFRDISHLEDLSLSSRTMLYMGFADVVHMPMFNNLTRLDVELVTHCCPILPFLLDCSPNIVNLQLVQEPRQPEIEWREPQHVPKCLLSSLEVIHFMLLEDYDTMMEMIIYFLNNAMVLRNMDISSLDLDLVTETNIR